MHRVRIVSPLVAVLLAAPAARAQSPTPAGTPVPTAVVTCPEGFAPAAPARSPAAACRRRVVTWSVTTCADSAFRAYRVLTGADRCGPTEVPGVGAPPGVTATRAVSCPAPGYAVVADRTGLRDRCERTQVEYAPAAAARGRP